MWLQEFKLVLHPVLMLCHLLWDMSPLGLCELAVTCPLRLNSGISYLDRQLATVGEPVPGILIPCFVREKFISLVVQLLVVLHNSLLT